MYLWPSDRIDTRTYKINNAHTHILMRCILFLFLSVNLDVRSIINTYQI